MFCTFSCFVVDLTQLSLSELLSELLFYGFISVLLWLSCLRSDMCPIMVGWSLDGLVGWLLLFIYGVVFIISLFGTCF